MSTRREFITLLGGAAAAWPLAVRAQQSEKIRRIGVLMNTGPDDPEGKTRNVAFERALQELGWTDGRNVRIDYRWGAGDPDVGTSVPPILPGRRQARARSPPDAARRRP
jgi:putative ABC transport system substrate-binding protein